MNSFLLVFQGMQSEGNFGRNLPLVIVGALTFLAGILSIILPETLNTNLPDSIKDAENFGRYLL